MEISKHEIYWLQSEGAKMLRNLGVKQGDNVIDFGCGEGRYTIPLSQIIGKQGCVYAIEHDKKAIAIIQERLSIFSTPSIVKFQEIDNIETASTISNSTINVIIVFDVLQYIQDWDLLFSYFFRVLNPMGVICIYPAAVPHPGAVNIELVIEKMKKIGFQGVKTTNNRMMHNVDMVNDVVYSFTLK